TPPVHPSNSSSSPFRLFSFDPTRARARHHRTQSTPLPCFLPVRRPQDHRTISLPS
uniref:Uncharacterized protein n=1 Tax=Setaria italica TaxID=4555 RepID=A0A0Q3QFI3_SETIT